MARLKIPLLSFDAKKSIGKALTFTRRHGKTIAEAKPEPFDPRATLQLDWRHMFLKVVALWNALTASEKQEWESLARRHHLTGYQWFVSQALRPNPGIYLPLQGGKMSGDIDMDTNRLLKLPLPTTDQEAATKKYHDDNLPTGGYTEGARVYHNADQSIASGSDIILAFNSELYDTDSIHDTVFNNSRLTCKTAGKYLISANVFLAKHLTGLRDFALFFNATLTISRYRVSADGNTDFIASLSTVWNMAVDDFVQVKIYQNSGVNLLCRAFVQYSPHFMMQRVG